MRAWTYLVAVVCFASMPALYAQDVGPTTPVPPVPTDTEIRIAELKAEIQLLRQRLSEVAQKEQAVEAEITRLRAQLRELEADAILLSLMGLPVPAELRIAMASVRLDLDVQYTWRLNWGDIREDLERRLKNAEAELMLLGG